MVVTHDQDEAMTMADRMAVMDHGRLVQIGPPDVIYEAPVESLTSPSSSATSTSSWRADRLRSSTAASSGSRPRSQGPVELDDDAERLRARASAMLIGLRPEKIALSHDEPAQSVNKVRRRDLGHRLSR